MSVYWLTVAATLYLLGFFIPLLIQVILEYLNRSKNVSFIERVSNTKLLKSIILSYKKEDVVRSLSKTCFIMGLLSLILSNISMLVMGGCVSDQILSLFIGLWAPTLICIGIYIKK